MTPSTGKMAGSDRAGTGDGRGTAPAKAAGVLFPLLLFWWPFVAVRQGVDLADTTYALTNVRYIDRLDPMWLLATWLPNVTGAALSSLPGGGTLLGMKVWCTLFVCVTAELSYFALGRLSPAGGGRERFPAPLRFAGLWIAESLCWCPVVILYNYLTYFLVTLASILLLSGFAAGLLRTPRGEGDAARPRRRFFAAGVCLGLNLFVRFPNAAEVLLIVAVWFYAALAERKDTAAGESAEEGGSPKTGRDAARESRANSGITARILRRIAKETGVCALGYIAGVIIPVVIISLRYGFGAYLQMIGDLFSMTSGAADYTPGGMLASILGAYATTLKELAPAALALAIGTAGFFFAGERRAPRRAAILLSAILLALLFRLYYAAGVFTRNYQYYDCVFEPAMMVLLLALVLCALAACGLLRTEPFLRAAAVLVLLLIAVTPIGSNNYTFPVVNNLFLILPVTFAILRAAAEQLAGAAYAARSSEAGKRGRKHADAVASAFRLPFLAWAAALLLLLAVQGSAFHLRFAFGDGTDGTARDTVITGIPRARGMATTQANARALEELYQRMNGSASVPEERTAIVFGGAPGLHYLLELPPALFTAWPDLDSNETVRVEAAIADLALSGERPLVILRGDRRMEPSPWDFGAPEKVGLILDYLSETGYNKLFRVDGGDGVFYEVYACE